MKLHNYFRSSASYRVRIALCAKGLPYDYVPVHLVKGEHRAPGFASHVGDALVPALQTDDGQWLNQSLAIIEWLDEAYPDTPPMLPGDALARARIRALALQVACEIHPINNLRVLSYLKSDLGLGDEAKNQWYQHWCRSGLEAFERQLALLAAERNALGLPPSTFCWGGSLTLADCALVPQIFNAQRFNVNLDGLPLTMAAYHAALATDAVQKAQPSACPDAQA